METVTSILIPAIVESVFGALTEAVGLSDWLRQRLGRDPEKLAFHQALTQALTDSATHYPGRDLRYFAEILRDIGGPLLARTLQPAATLPTADELTNVWLNHLTVDSLIHYQADFTQFAIHFLDRLQFHLKNQQPLRWIIQARHERNSEEIMRRTADAAEQSATSIKALQQEVARLTTTLVTVLQTGSSSTVITEGGANIGANVSAQNFAGRDLTIKNYFVTGLPHLVIDYSSRIQDFLLEYLGSKRKKVPFGGRQQQLAELNAWLDDSAAPPYYLMTAEAGRGKSALVCRWLAQLTTRADFDVIFVPISIRFETATQDVVFAALAARLANLYESEPEKLPSASLTAEQWKGVCQSYLRREPPTGKQLVVILDGLDESTGWTPTRSLFSADPPNRLRVLVTARTRPRENETNGWANILGWDNPQLAHTATLPGLERRGVEEALASMGNPLNKLVTKVDVVGELHRLSEGDPLLIRLYVDAVLAQSEAINTLRAEDLHSIQPGLAGYFERWWQDQQEQWRIQGRDPLVEQANLRHLLNAIAAALGPLTLEDLAALDSDLTDSMLVRRLLYQVSRWLVGDGKTQGYSYSHPRLGYYFWEKLSNHEQRMWDKRFCKWGKQTQDDLNTGTLVPDYAPHYLLKHYAIHLERAEAPPMDFYALISNGWRQAWAKMDYRITGFLTDVDRAWKQAKHAYSPMKQGCSIHITQQIKAALCRSSGIALDNKLPPELLLRAVQLALYTPIEALATVKLHIDDQKRTDMLAMLAPYLPQDLYSEALVIVKEIKNESMRATILTAFAPYLPNFLLNEVLLLVGEIREQAKHASVLMALAPHLSESMIYQTLEVIKRIEDEATRITALSTFTPYLSKPLLADALTIIKETEDKNLCITALSTLAPHLPNSLLPDALLLIRDIRDESLRVTALSTFAPRFSQPLIAIALELIQKIKDNSLRINALSVLAPYLSESLQLEALSIARGIEDETKSITALATLSPYLPDPVRISVLDEVIASINNIEEDTNYFDRLIALIRDALAVAKKIGNVDKDTTILTIALKQVVDCISIRGYKDKRIVTLVEKVEQTLVVSGKKKNKDAYITDLTIALKDASAAIIEKIYVDRRITALTMFFPYLPEPSRCAILDQVLPLVWKIKYKERCIAALISLAPYLSESQLTNTLMLVKKINEEGKRVASLIELAPHLSESQIVDSLNMISAIQSEYERTAALISFAPYISELSKINALDIANTLQNPVDYISVLCVLVTHLSESLRINILEKGLLIIREIDSPAILAITLAKIAPFLPDRLLTDALLVAEEIVDEDNRVTILSAFASNLPETLIARVLESAKKISNDSLHSDLLPAVAPYLSKQLVTSAIEIAQTIGDKENQTIALGALTSYLPESLLIDLMTKVSIIANEYKRAVNLSLLVPYLSESLIVDALNIVKAIETEEWSAYALVVLAPYLPEWLVVDALAIIKEVWNDDSRANIINAFLPRLSDSIQVQILTEAQKIWNKSRRFAALSTLSTQLSHPLQIIAQEKALVAARGIVYESGRATALAALTPNLSLSLRISVLTEALTVVKGIGNEYNRATTLGSIAPYLTKELFEAALLIAKGIDNEASHTAALVALIPYLPKEIAAETFSLVKEVRNEYSRAILFSTFIPFVPEHLRIITARETLKSISSMVDEDYRSEALIVLAPHLQLVLIDEVIEVIKTIQDQFRYNRLLSAFAPYLPKELLADWLASLKAIQDEDTRVLLLNKFVTNLPRVLMVRGLDLIKEIKNEVNRIHLLNTVIPYLQPLLLKQVFEIIKEVKDGTLRSMALNTLIPHLPEPFLAETLVMVAEISDNTERTVTLEKLAVKLAQSSVIFSSVTQDSFDVTLKALCRHPRPIFLLDLAALMPFILALAGDEAPQAAEGIYQAIQEVCGWWP